MKTVCVFLDDSFLVIIRYKYSHLDFATCETMRNKRHTESTDICKGIVVPSSVIADLHISVQTALPFSSCYSRRESGVCVLLSPLHVGQPVQQHVCEHINNKNKRKSSSASESTQQTLTGYLVRTSLNTSLTF